MYKKKDNLRLIAFYLPQYHPIPENDTWWGKGFTEWTNVTKAKPNFNDHYQPHLPTDLGFYDLRLPQVRLEQANLAKQYGVYGFCYYYYWFNGKRLLNGPIDDVLNSQMPDFPFCMCWANENWTRTWDGLDNNILIAQNYSPENDRQFIQGLIPFFNDDRYIRIKNRPLLIIYRAELLPNPRESVKIWKEECRLRQIEEPYICCVHSFSNIDPNLLGFDAAIEFPPLLSDIYPVKRKPHIVNNKFCGEIYSYVDICNYFLNKPRTDYKLFKTIIPSWDNTARRQNNSCIFIESSPQRYQSWLENILEQTQQTFLDDDERIIFINAWNEWGEGCHLEPDIKYGHQFLQATQEAFKSTSSLYSYSLKQNSYTEAFKKSPLVSVCIPTYNGEDYVLEALQSVVNQSYDNLEVLISDDNSSDNTIKLVSDFIDSHSDKSMKLFTHERFGLVQNWNFCISQAKGKYIKFLFQDDLIAECAIEKMVCLAEQDSEIGLIFSPREVFIEEEAMKNIFSLQLFNGIQEIHKKWTCLKPIQHGHELLSDPCMFDTFGENKIGEPSTTLIRKESFNAVGLFDANLCHVVDTDMWYRIMSKYKIGFINEPLSRFRIHSKQQSVKNHNSDVVDRDVYKFFEKALSDGSYLFLSTSLKISIRKQFNSFPPLSKYTKSYIFRRNFKNKIKNTYIVKYIKRKFPFIFNFLKKSKLS
jgi:glycosyltransferase involved in cell wall biosynthesis